MTAIRLARATNTPVSYWMARPWLEVIEWTHAAAEADGGGK